MQTLRTSLCVTVVALLAACGGGGGLVDETATRALVDDTPTRDDVISAIQRAERADTRIGNLPGTKFDAMPTAGTATFEGQGGFFIDPVVRQDNDDLSIFGDATLRADFRRGTLTGEITDLTGVQGLNPATGQIFDVDGTVNIGNNRSAIGARARANNGGVRNDALANVSGRLVTEGRGTFEIRGLAEGKFVGTRANRAGTADAPRGVVLSTDAPSITRNGRRIQGDFTVYGEN